MINVRVIYNDTAININFPCDSNVLEAKLMELHVEDLTNALMFIEKIEGVIGTGVTVYFKKKKKKQDTSEIQQ